MSTNKTQTRLLGGPSGESVSIKTSGRVIRPAMAIPNQIVSEAKLRFDDDGLHVTAVDPANVSMVEFHAHASAFEAYTVDAEDEVLVGTNLDNLTTKLSNARLGKRTDDPVQLDIDETRSIVEIAREYDRTNIRYADEQLNIDPDSIREEPDVPTMDLNAEATVDVQAFADAVDHIASGSDHVTLRRDGDSMLMNGAGHEDSPSSHGSAVEFEGVLEAEDDPESVTATYSIDYVTKFADAVRKGKADDVTLRWGEEFPMFVEFGRTVDEDVAYEASMMLAPRITGE